jgi:hypothetical protein
MTKAEVADELVRTVYSSFATDTLREMAEVGKDLRESRDPAISYEVAELFQSALEREIERRGLAQ